MSKNTSSNMLSTAMGIAIGTAVGAVGAYAVQKHPKEIKRATRKISRTASRAAGNIEKVINNR